MLRPAAPALAGHSQEAVQALGGPGRPPAGAPWLGQ